MSRPEAPVVDLAGVTVSIGRQPILQDVSLRLAPGRWHALLGPNGSGKTTLLRAALGLAATSAGSVQLFGAAPPPRPGQVGVSFGPRLLHPSRRARTELALRVRALGGSGRDVDTAWAETGLVDPRVPCGALSLGQAQRLSIVCALVGRPRLLVLDEPTVGLDVAAQQWLHGRLEDLRADGGCVWVSSHDLTEVERSATDVSVLSGGRLVHCGGLGALLSDDVAIRLESSDPALLVRVLDGAGLAWGLSPDGAVIVHGQAAAPLGQLLAQRGVPLVAMARERDSLEQRLRELLSPPVPVGAGR